MEKIFSILKLRKEANLLDSELYILKALLAVATAYIWIEHNSLLRLDSISVLFGLMLTLEPVTLTGIRNGFSQIYASVLGAVSTAIIIYISGRINQYTIAISVAFTLYVCLKINWREVSPVAIFTSIYMTQYVQKDVFGNPSMLLTFRLRMSALGAGVLVAIIYNWIFSFVSYKEMLKKRMFFIIEDTYNNFLKLENAIKNNDRETIHGIKRHLPKTLNNIDWVLSLYDDIKKENNLRLKVSGITDVYLERFQNIVLILRNSVHLNYDICYVLSTEDIEWDYIKKNESNILEFMDLIMCRLESCKNSNVIKQIKESDWNEVSRTLIDNEKEILIIQNEEGKNGMHLSRIYHDLQMMLINVNRL